MARSMACTIYIYCVYVDWEVTFTLDLSMRNARQTHTIFSEPRYVLWWYFPEFKTYTIQRQFCYLKKDRNSNKTCFFDFPKNFHDSWIKRSHIEIKHYWELFNWKKNTHKNFGAIELQNRQYKIGAKLILTINTLRLDNVKQLFRPCVQSTAAMVETMTEWCMYFVV